MNEQLNIGMIQPPNQLGIDQYRLQDTIREISVKTEKYDPRSHPLLTKTQEQIFFRSMRTGDTAASKAVFTPDFLEEMDPKDSKRWAYVLATNETISGVIAACNYRFIIHIIKKTGYLVNADMLDAGQEGILKSLTTFDYTKGTKFSTYASWWILNSLQRERGKQLGLGRSAFDAFNKALRIRHAYKALHDADLTFPEEPTDEEIDQQMRFSYPKFSDNLRAEVISALNKPRIISLNKDVQPDSDDSAFDAITQGEESKVLYYAIEKYLSLDEITALQAIFGLKGSNKQSLREYALLSNQSVIDVQTLLEKAMKTLQKVPEIVQLRAGSEPVTDETPELIDQTLPTQTVIFEQPNPKPAQIDPNLSRREKISELVKEGYPVPQIAEMFGQTILEFIECGGLLDLPKLEKKKGPTDRREGARNPKTEAVDKYLKEHPPGIRMKM